MNYHNFVSTSMGSWLKLMARGIVVILFVLLLLETIFYFMTPSQYSGIGFIINLKQASTHIDKLNNGFNEVDPLLGYAKTHEKLVAGGFIVQNGCIILSTTDDTAGLVKILITGGSTSDISLYPKDWPIEFCHILKEHGIKAKIYLAAVGGYSSGQELLKLMRDGIDTEPWVHISYSGANEFSSTTYVSVYEDVFYRRQLDMGPTSWLLPNTVLFMRDLLQLNHRKAMFGQQYNIPNARFWEKNMRLMHGIATENHYSFIGVLQPVLGSGKYDQLAGEQFAIVADYKKHYPEMRQTATRYSDFLVDLSDIFDTCKGPVFIDNCHIEDVYQDIVANDIYRILIEKKVLSAAK